MLRGFPIEINICKDRRRESEASDAVGHSHSQLDGTDPPVYLLISWSRLAQPTPLLCCHCCCRSCK